MPAGSHNKILVVCTGNICRSPVAEAMLRQCLPGKHIRSAGLSAMVGQGVDEMARELADMDNLQLGDHKAQQITGDLIQWADLILVMSQQQRTALAQRAPLAIGKTMLLGHWIPDADSAVSLEIPDPYRKSREVFQYVHNIMRQATQSWANKI
jgi:protein-tyrosine phosphatase